MFENEYYRFNEMLKKGNVARTTLHKMIKDGKVRSNDISGVKVYSLKDVINNKPRKK
jgi:hypothetical protein